MGCEWAARAPTSCLRGRPPKSQPARECPGNLSPSLPDRGGADLDGYSTMSEAPSSRHCRRRRQNEKCLTPHTSLQGYLGRWVHSLEDGGNITIPKLLACMDLAFSDVHDYDTMIRSLYEIRQKESESVEEYMLQIHEVVMVIHRVYPDRISDQGRNLTRDRFYHGLSPSLCDALGFTVAELHEREQVNTSLDTLYTLTKKMEVHQPSRSHRSGSGSSEGLQR